MNEGTRVWSLYAAGQIRRWHQKGHTNRPQDLAQHSHGVALWISILHPNPSALLLKAALHHDLPEVATGDTPRYIKQDNPELKVILEKAEAKAALFYELVTETDLVADEVRWLHACDLLDAWLFLFQNILCHNEMVREDFNRATRAMRDYAADGTYPYEPTHAMECILKLYPNTKVW